jgi:hypothetical protein
MAIGERPELHDTVRGRGSFLAAHNLAALHESLGDSDQARHWREQALALGLPEALATRAAAR